MASDPLAAAAASFKALPAQDRTDIVNALRWLEPAVADIFKARINALLDSRGLSLADGIVDGMVDTTLNQITSMATAAVT